LPLAAVLVLHASTLEVSLLGAAGMLPFLLFASRGVRSLV